MSSPPSATADILRDLDPKIWRACAGPSVQIPTLYSRVYYYPQGHVEHCCPSSSISSSPSFTAPVPCIISSIELLTDPITDEMFAHLTLEPVSPEHFNLPNSSRRYESNEEVVTTYAKILTPSDANNGGGFSVPRHCADSIFPPLDFEADPPVQVLSITDMRGLIWDFRHIYRGTPRRHLLTTGWSKFVNSKKLIAGDSVVFMRKSFDELFIGVRRAPISNNIYDDDFLTEYFQIDDGEGKEEDVSVKKGFRRVGKGLLTAEAVSEAISKAAQGKPFEVVYYPTAGWSEFVVRAEDVQASMASYWGPGTRVKMAMETEDSSRITWYQGTVLATVQETGPWRGSPWKQLQITWDEPEVMQNLKRVNPWQVETVSNMNPPQLLATYPPTKRLKFPGGEEGEMLCYGRGAPSPYMLPYTTFPAGMQGARHYGFGSYNSTGFIGENTPPQLRTNNFLTQIPRLGTEMMNLSSSPSDDLSPSSNTLSSGPSSARGNSFQLFGKTINLQESSESGHAAESALHEEDEVTKLSLKHASQGM